MKELQKEFMEMSRYPIFEIEGNDGEHHIFHIEASKKGLKAGGVTNTGFIPYDGLEVKWDDTFSLDEHLQELYDRCLKETM